MSRLYPSSPWSEKSGVAFKSGGPEGEGKVLRIKKMVSSSPPPSFFRRVYEDWRMRRPYYLILFTVAFIVLLAIILAIRSIQNA